MAIIYTPDPDQCRLSAFVQPSLVRAAENDVAVKCSEPLEMRRVIEQMAGDLQAAQPDLIPFKQMDSLYEPGFISRLRLAPRKAGGHDFSVSCGDVPVSCHRAGTAYLSLGGELQPPDVPRRIAMNNRTFFGNGDNDQPNTPAASLGCLPAGVRPASDAVSEAKPKDDHSGDACDPG
jgi:hypothetical protein